MTLNRRDSRKKGQEFYVELKKGKIPGNINPSFLLKLLKYNLTEDEVNKILETANDHFYNIIVSNPICSQYSELSSFELYPEQPNIKKDFDWVCMLILDYVDEIKLFLDYEKRFEKLLFFGKYEEAKALLEEIESNITFSHWSIQQKLFIAELNKGFRENKDILAKIISDENSRLTNFFSHYTSIRIESNISVGQYQAYVDEYIEALNIPSLKQYIFYKIDFFRYSFDPKSINTILSYESTLSIVDRYKAFIQLSQVILTNKSFDSIIKKHIISLLSKIRKQINDINIDNLLAFSGDLSMMPVDVEFIKILDAYTNSSYSEAVELCKLYIYSNPSCYQAITIYCKSLCCLRIEHTEFAAGSLIDNIIINTLKIYKKEQEQDSGLYSELYKICHFLGNHPVSFGILNFLATELPFNINKGNLDLVSVLNSQVINPALNQYLTPKIQPLFLQAIDKAIPNSSMVSIIRKVLKNGFVLTDKIDHFSLRELKYIAIVQKNNEELESALSIYDYILSTEVFKKELRINCTFIDIAIGKFNCLIRQNKLVQALEFCTDILIDSPQYLNRFLNPVFINDLILNQDPIIQKNICWPIFLKFYELDVDNYQIYVAYDNFLFSNNCKTPRDFFDKIDINNKRHICFLEKVCKHDILYSSPYFQDQDELDLSRIEICNFLTSNLYEYAALEIEVSELLRKVLIRKGIKQIDYSKIYVDIKGIKLILDKDLRESFSRNVEIASLPVDQLEKIVDSIGNVLVYYVESAQETSVSESNLPPKVKLTGYNRFLHFSEAFIKTRDLFLFNPDHGLDTYLSMRIRHGTLPGQIRSVFESANLITSFSEHENSYSKNEAILSKLHFLSDPSLSQVSNFLNDFSRAIDNLAEILKTQTIQIKTEIKNTKGLFDYCYYEDDVLKLFIEKFGSIKDFDIFLNEVIDVLWKRTEKNLSEIRRYLIAEFTRSIEHIFDTLEKQLQSLTDFNQESYEKQEFLNSLKNCRTAITIEIQKISEWFKRSNKKYIEEFDFSILLDSSVQTLQRSFRNAKISVQNNSNLKIDGDLFPYFTDMFFYLLHNALKHSKLSSEDLEITIRITQNNENIILDIINNVLANDSYLDIIKQKIETTKNILSDSSSYQKIVNKEGGTGYPKIKKILTQDLQRKNSTINLMLDQNDSNPFFKTNISFEIAGLSKNLL